MESTNYLTADEVRAAQTLHQRAPYSITGISTSIFSVARHYGGMKFQGCQYTYMGADHDECVRDDVLNLVTKMRKKPVSKKETPAPQTMLDLGA